MRLEAYLDGLDQGCRRRAGSLVDTALRAGVAPPVAVDELDLVAAWCRRSADEIRWRRALLDESPPLPVPPFTFTSRGAARDRAEALVARLVEAMAERPPRPEVVRRLLAEAARGASSPTFVAALVDGLGPGRVSRIEALFDDLEGTGSEVAPGTGGAPADPAVDPTDGGEVSATTLAEIRALVVGVVGPEHPVVEWLDHLPPIVADLVESSDEIHATVGNVVLAGRALRRAPTLALTPLAAGTLALDLIDAVRDPSDVKVWNTSSSFLATVAPAAGPAAPAVFLGAALCGLFGWLAATARMSPSQLDDHERRYDPDTGAATYPSGSASNPWVDGAGVPLDPHYA